MALRTRSGHPSADDEDTVMTALSGICAATRSALTTLLTSNLHGIGTFQNQYWNVPSDVNPKALVGDALLNARLRVRFQNERYAGASWAWRANQPCANALGPARFSELHFPIKTSPSISIANPRGNPATPIADRAWRPTSCPKTSMTRSLNPFTTIC